MLTRLRPKAQKGYVRKEMTNSAKRMKLDESVPSSPTVEIQNGDVDSVTGRSTEIPTDRTPPRATLREIAVLSVDAGTPICTLYSPFPNLPAQAKWATNTTDHIMFENLPESTGKYENIRGIITKIRENKKLDFDAMADVV
jgi:zinc finger CCHC domain-containing protein 8